MGICASKEAVKEINVIVTGDPFPEEDEDYVPWNPADYQFDGNTGKNKATVELLPCGEAICSVYLYYYI